MGDCYYLHTKIPAVLVTEFPQSTVLYLKPSVITIYYGRPTSVKSLNPLLDLKRGSRIRLRVISRSFLRTSLTLLRYLGHYVQVPSLPFERWVVVKVQKRLSRTVYLCCNPSQSKIVRGDH